MDFFRLIISALLSSTRLFGLYRNIFIPRNILAGAVNFIGRRPTAFPISINWPITSSCNFSCRMCVSTQCHAEKVIKSGDVDLPTIMRFVGAVCMYQPVVHIGGGEPFMRKDMLNIVAAIKDKGLKCLLTTNGFLMDAHVRAGILKYVDVLIVSLYGPREVHDKVVGINGAFDQTVVNLKPLIARKRKGIKIIISCIPLPENIDSLPSLIVELQLLGVDAIKIEQLNFQTRREFDRSAPFVVDGFDVTPRMFQAEQEFPEIFVNKVIELRNNLSRFGLPVHLKPYLSSEQVRAWYCDAPSRERGCRFITHSVFINHNGDILPCQFLPRCVFGNIKNDSLKDVWNSEAYQKFRKMIDHARPNVCLRCCKN